MHGSAGRARRDGFGDDVFAAIPPGSRCRVSRTRGVVARHSDRTGAWHGIGPRTDGERGRQGTKNARHEPACLSLQRRACDGGFVRSLAPQRPRPNGFGSQATRKPREVDATTPWSHVIARHCMRLDPAHEGQIVRRHLHHPSRRPLDPPPHRLGLVSAQPPMDGCAADICEPTATRLG